MELWSADFPLVKRSLPFYLSEQKFFFLRFRFFFSGTYSYSFPVFSIKRLQLFPGVPEVPVNWIRSIFFSLPTTNSLRCRIGNASLTLVRPAPDNSPYRTSFFTIVFSMAIGRLFP